MAGLTCEMLGRVNQMGTYKAVKINQDIGSSVYKSLNFIHKDMQLWG